MAVHQSCYGITPVPRDEWKCDLCKTYGEKGKYLRCALCTRRGGAMKPCDRKSNDEIWNAIHHDYWDHAISGPVTEEIRESPPRKWRGGHRYEPEKLYYNFNTILESDLGTFFFRIHFYSALLEEEDCTLFEPRSEYAWIHLSCAFWIPEVFFHDIDHNSDIRGIQNLESDRLGLTCSICSSSVGACIQCRSEGCSQIFHPECARRTKLHMEFNEDDLKSPYNIYCEKHTPLHLSTTLNTRKQIYRNQLFNLSNLLEKNAVSLDKIHTKHVDHQKRSSFFWQRRQQRLMALQMARLQEKSPEPEMPSQQTERPPPRPRRTLAEIRAERDARRKVKREALRAARAQQPQRKRGRPVKNPELGTIAQQKMARRLKRKFGKSFTIEGGVLVPDKKEKPEPKERRGRWGRIRPENIIPADYEPIIPSNYTSIVSQPKELAPAPAPAPAPATNNTTRPFVLIFGKNKPQSKKDENQFPNQNSGKMLEEDRISTAPQSHEKAKEIENEDRNYGSRSMERPGRMEPEKPLRPNPFEVMAKNTTAVSSSTQQQPVPAAAGQSVPKPLYGGILTFKKKAGPAPPAPPPSPSMSQSHKPEEKLLPPPAPVSQFIPPPPTVPKKQDPIKPFSQNNHNIVPPLPMQGQQPITQPAKRI